MNRKAWIKEETAYIVCCENCGEDMRLEADGLRCKRHGGRSTMDELELLLELEGVTLDEFKAAWGFVDSEDPQDALAIQRAEAEGMVEK